MKTFERILRAIRNLPEEVRKLLAILFLLVVAILLFNKWSIGVSSSLTLSSVPSSANGQQFSSETTNSLDVPAPLASIADSFKSLEKLVKPFSADSSGKASPNIRQKINNLTASLYASLEKTWQYIYEPLK